MDTQTVDVSLEALLGDEASQPAGASAGTEKDQTASEGVKTPDKSLETESSERANARIRELVAENSDLKGLVVQAQKARSTDDIENYIETQNMDDETKTILKEVVGKLKSSFDKSMEPKLEDLSRIKFDSEFADLLSTVPQLKGQKDELWNEQKRNPNLSLKQIAGSMIIDLAASRVKPSEGAGESADRSASPDLDGLSKEELYKLQAKLKPQ